MDRKILDDLMTDFKKNGGKVMDCGDSRNAGNEVTGKLIKITKDNAKRGVIVIDTENRGQLRVLANKTLREGLNVGNTYSFTLRPVQNYSKANSITHILDLKPVLLPENKRKRGLIF